MIAAISSEVATGRRMKSRDGLIRSNRHSGAPHSGEPGIQEHRALEYGFRVRELSPAPRNDRCRAAAKNSTSLAAPPPPFTRRPVFRRGGLLASCRRLRRASRRSAGLTGLGELYLGAFFETVGAVGDDDLAGHQPLRHRDVLAVA